MSQNHFSRLVLQLPILKDKFVVHETHFCSGYYMYLSSSHEYSQASFYLCQRTSVLLLAGNKLTSSLRKEASVLAPVSTSIDQPVIPLATLRERTDERLKTSIRHYTI